MRRSLGPRVTSWRLDGGRFWRRPQSNYLRHERFLLEHERLGAGNVRIGDDAEGVNLVDDLPVRFVGHAKEALDLIGVKDDVRGSAATELAKHALVDDVAGGVHDGGLAGVGLAVQCDGHR